MTARNLNHEKIRRPGQVVCRLCGAFFDDTIEGVCPQKLARVMGLPQDDKGRFHPRHHTLTDGSTP